MYSIILLFFLGVGTTKCHCTKSENNATLKPTGKIRSFDKKWINQTRNNQQIN